MRKLAKQRLPSVCHHRHMHDAWLVPCSWLQPRECLLSRRAYVPVCHVPQSASAERPLNLSAKIIIILQTSAKKVQIIHESCDSFSFCPVPFIVSFLFVPFLSSFLSLSVPFLSSFLSYSSRFFLRITSAPESPLMSTPVVTPSSRSQSFRRVTFSYII